MKQNYTTRGNMGCIFFNEINTSYNGGDTMNKYNLIIAKDWDKLETTIVSENKMQEFIQKCYEENWVILRWF